MNRLAIPILLLPLASCATWNAMMNPVSPADVAAIEITLTTAEKLATHYTSLPACPQPNGNVICADVTLKAKIKADDNQAYAAVAALKNSSAVGAPAAMSVAQAAIAALQNEVPQ